MTRSLLVLTVSALTLLASERADAYDPSGAPPPRWFEGERGFSMKVSAGPSYRRIYRVDAGGAQIGVAFGGQTGSGGWYGAVRAELGQTDRGLSIRHLGLGPTWEAPIGPWRFGFGAHSGIISIQRASSGAWLTDVTLGGHLFSTVDVYRTSSYAATVGLFFATEGMDGDDPPQMHHVSARLGVRFF
ncbi:MAG: hypothetical protein VB934_02180 [Polyangiaceae bacterium]